jgi:serine/threonine protein kinase
LLSYHRTNVHVALKICRSDSETREAAKAEIEVLNFTRSHYRQSAHIVALLDHFEHASSAYPDQMHIVLAFELLGPNLLDFLNQHMMRAQSGEVEKGEAGGLPLALVQRFADQILEGTAFLHDLCRHIHTDLKVRLNHHVPSPSRLLTVHHSRKT